MLKPRTKSVLLWQIYVLLTLILVLNIARYIEPLCERLWGIDQIGILFRWCASDYNLPQNATQAFISAIILYFVFLLLYIVIGKLKKIFSKANKSARIMAVVIPIIVAGFLLTWLHFRSNCLRQSPLPFNIFQCERDPYLDYINSSFPAGTKILTPTGAKLIEDSEVGDEVISFDEIGKEKKISRIEKIFTRKASNFILINNQLETTEKHPFALIDSSNKGNIIWKIAGELKMEDCMFITIDHCEKVNAIENISRQPTTVFNLQVSGSQNYFVNLGRNYVLVHNKTVPGI